MASRDSGQIPETAAERALADVAKAKLADYKQRWLPLQMRMAEQIQTMGKADSEERVRARGASAADTNVAFGRAGEQLASQQQNRGINTGSSRFKLAQANLGSDQARSRGMGRELAEQSVDDAYVGGLQKIMALGRGQEASASENLGRAAGLSADVAARDAYASAAERAGGYEIGGLAAGGALGAMRYGKGGTQFGQGLNYVTPMGSPNVGPNQNGLL
jgi:hypothetical protein